MAAGSTARLRWLGADGPDAAWAVGMEGDVLRGDETGGSVSRSADPVRLSSLGSDGAGGLWAVDRSHRLRRWTGATWAPVAAAPGAVRPTAIGVAGPGDLWLAGEDGALFQGDGTVWTPRETGVSNDLFVIWADRDGGLWAGGEELAVLHHAGSGPIPLAPPR